MHGDDLAVFLALEGVGLTLFLESRKEDGWRKYFFWIACFLVCLIGIAWPKIESAWPAAADYGRSVAKTPETWFALFLLVMAFVSFSGVQSKITKAVACEIGAQLKNLPQTNVETNIVSKENTKSDALEIRFEESDLFAQIHQFDNGTIHRVYSFKLYNVGNGFLTDTSVILNSTIPAMAPNTVKIMATQEPLPLGHYRTIKLVHYAEINPTPPQAPDTMVLGWTHFGGFMYGQVPSFKPATKDAPLVVEIEAKARECAPHRATFRIWVDENPKRLRVQKF